MKWPNQCDKCVIRTTKYLFMLLHTVRYAFNWATVARFVFSFTFISFIIISFSFVYAMSKPMVKFHSPQPVGCAQNNTFCRLVHQVHFLFVCICVPYNIILTLNLFTSLEYFLFKTNCEKIVKEKRTRRGETRESN